MSTWKKVKWPYDSSVTEDTYCMQIYRGKVYLRNNKKECFPFTVACGHNSDRTFSGCFFNLPVNTLKEAMAALEVKNFD